MGIPLNDTDSIDNVADWTELYLIHNNTFSKADLTSFINMEKGSEPTPEFVDDIWNELGRRQKLYGAKPPFLLESKSVSSNKAFCKNSIYLMCVILSYDGNQAESL